MAREPYLLALTLGENTGTSSGPGSSVSRFASGAVSGCAMSFTGLVWGVRAQLSS